MPNELDPMDPNLTLHQRLGIIHEALDAIGQSYPEVNVKALAELFNFDSLEFDADNLPSMSISEARAVTTKHSVGAPSKLEAAPTAQMSITLTWDNLKA